MPQQGAAKVLSWVAANIREQRVARSLTQQQLASTMRIDLRYLQRVEAGDVNIGIITLGRFAVALEVAAEVLVREAMPQPRSTGRPPSGS